MSSMQSALPSSGSHSVPVVFDVAVVSGSVVVLVLVDVESVSSTVVTSVLVGRVVSLDVSVVDVELVGSVVVVSGSLVVPDVCASNMHSTATASGATQPLFPISHLLHIKPSPHRVWLPSKAQCSALMTGQPSIPPNMPSAATETKIERDE
jgi:hypothetical protein